MYILEVSVVRFKQAGLLLAVLGVVVSLSSAAHAEWKWSGYTQLRFNQWDSDLNKPDNDQFQIRRARIKLEGQVSEDTTITLQADFSKLVDDEKGSGSVELKDALITRKFSPEWFVTGGYTSVPFGYEVPLSDSFAWPLERSKVADALFPGQRDTGVYVHYRPAKAAVPQVDFGYGNGLHSWYDGTDRDTSSEAFIARAQWPLKNAGVAGLSYMMADRTRTIGGTSYDFDNQDAWGAHLRYNFPRNWTVQSDYYNGHQPVLSGGLPVNLSVDGWYGLAGYTLTSKPVTFFYRYDTYDFGGADDFNRNALGLVWDRNKNDRYTIQIEDGDDGKGTDFTNFAVQWQVKY